MSGGAAARRSGGRGFFVVLLVVGCARLPERAPAPVVPALEYLTIASFNIRDFSNSSRDDAELAQIVGVLRPYDLIAIQELHDEQVLQRAVALLEQGGGRYAYQVSDRVGTGGGAERYAFLYRTDHVSLVQAGNVYPDPEDALAREPFYAGFRAGHFDFTLMTVHAIYGSTKAQRRLEAQALAAIYQAVQDADPAEQDVLLLGDFNLSPDDPGFDQLRAIPTMTFVIAPPATTTITDASLYDNVWFQRQYVQEYTGTSGVDRFDERLFANDDSAALRTVSDHRPIWARFSVAGADDD